MLLLGWHEVSLRMTELLDLPRRAGKVLKDVRLIIANNNSRLIYPFVFFGAVTDNVYDTIDVIVVLCGLVYLARPRGGT